MPRRLILGLPGPREIRKQFTTYREHTITRVLAAADDALHEHLCYCLQYITFKRYVITTGRISYPLQEYNGDGQAEIALVVEDLTTTRVEVDTFPVGSVVPTTPEIHQRWRALVFRIVDMWLEKLDAETVPTPSERRKTKVSVRQLQQIKPTVGASREEWFAYKRQMGRKFTHKDLAAELSLAPAYVRQLYADWLATVEPDDTALQNS
jgi:hypothetical protein